MVRITDEECGEMWSEACEKNFPIRPYAEAVLKLAIAKLRAEHPRLMASSEKCGNATAIDFLESLISPDPDPAVEAVREVIGRRIGKGIVQRDSVCEELVAAVREADRDAK